MRRLLWAAIAALLSGLRSRRELILENLAFRQQLATVLQKHRPLIRPADRAFWVMLRRLWARWSDALIIVKPDTVVGWHRAGFALYWRSLSRHGRLRGRPPVGRQLRDLVRGMASENGWGAPRIHGELLKLGFKVSERTVSRYMQQHNRQPERRQSWLTFLRNHREVMVAMDLFVVPTASLRLLYVWFAIGHSRREIVHWSVTQSPTALWVVQQLREAFPFDAAARGLRYLLFDRDSIFSAAAAAAVTSMGLEPARTSYQSPWQNGVAERFVGSVRRELLDHVIILDDRHLRRLLAEYVTYYLEDRTHLGLGKDAPLARPVEPCPAGSATVCSRVRVGRSAPPLRLASGGVDEASAMLRIPQQRAGQGSAGTRLPSGGLASGLLVTVVFIRPAAVLPHPPCSPAPSPGALSSRHVLSFAAS